MLSHLESHKVLTANQHGFVKKRSCLTNLLESLESWTKLLDEGKGLDVLYLDYQKAFDTVPHRRLLAKLKWYGIDGKLLLWIENFLINRKMRVVVNDAVSVWTDVLSGVLQGSVLDPLLFVIYVNDIPSVVHNNIKMFADDTNIWSPIVTVDDAAGLQ